jgi:diguanylate cyclase (GGDEF)-like protein
METTKQTQCMLDKLKSLEIEQQHLQIVSQFAVEILSLNSSEELVWHLAKKVVARLGFEDVVIYLLNEENKLQQRAAFGNKNPSADTLLDPIEIEIGQGVVGMTALNQSPILIEDTRKYPGYIIDDQNRLSELAVPMMADGKMLGVIDSEHQQLGYYTPQHERTLVAIASIAAIKLVNNQTVAKLQDSIEQLEYSSKIQDTLIEIAELIFATDSITEFYERLHLCIARLTFAKNFYVALTANEGKALILPYCADEEDDVPVNEIIPLNEDTPSITAYVMQTKQPLLLYEDDLRRMRDNKQIYLIGSLPKAWLGVPFGEGNLQGVVVVQSYSDNYVFDKKDQQLLMFVAKHIRNAIERMQAKSDLRFLALHDPLTKLPNRVLFADRLEHAIVKAKRNKNMGLAVLFMDLDKFKQVNDSYGHHIGDKLLIAVADCVASCLRKSDTFCRLGGDEFAILLEELHGKNEAKNIAEKIVSKLQSPLQIEQRQILITTSIGIAIYDSNKLNANTLLVHADEAMYQAKLHGRNQIYLYQTKSDSAFTASHKVERDFLPAIQKKQLYLEFQPIIDLASGEIVFAEALVRWRHPEQGIIPPIQFIGELEKSGHIHQLDEFVLNRALEYLSAWQPFLPPKFRVSINVSSAGFISQSFMQKLSDTYQSTPDVLQQLCIEITEQSIVNNVGATQINIKLLRDMGIQIALDDFGTGYSSLSYLHQFTFDFLKIDRSFIMNIEPGQDKNIILETIIKLAKSLNIKTTAEGIETLEQYKLLKNMHCTHAQGFYMSRPVAVSELLTLIRNKTRFGQELLDSQE